MSFLKGKDFGSKLCRFLGLPPGTGRIEITIDHSEMVKIEYSGLLDLDQEKALKFIHEDIEKQKIEKEKAEKEKFMEEINQLKDSIKQLREERSSFKKILSNL